MWLTAVAGVKGLPLSSPSRTGFHQWQGPEDVGRCSWESKPWARAWVNELQRSAVALWHALPCVPCVPTVFSLSFLINGMCSVPCQKCKRAGDLGHVRQMKQPSCFCRQSFVNHSLSSLLLYIFLLFKRKKYSFTNLGPFWTIRRCLYLQGKFLFTVSPSIHLLPRRCFWVWSLADNVQTYS